MSAEARADGLMGNSAGPHAAEQLAAYAARIMRIEGEINDLQADKKEVYAEAKACGFDTKVLKQVIARLRRPVGEVDEEDTIRQVYEEAIRRVRAEREDEDFLK